MNRETVREGLLDAREQVTRALRAVSVPEPSTGDLVVAIQDARAALERAAAATLRQEDITS